MTIIASFQRPDGIITFSDTMVSQPSVLVKKPATLPLAQQDFFKNKQISAPINKEFVASGFTQKCIFIGDNCLALWAGSAIVAKTVLREAFKSHQSGKSHETINDLAARIGISKATNEDLSLIIFHDLGDHIIQDTLNVSTKYNKSTDIIYAGSGSYPVIEDFEDNTTNDNYEAFYTTFLNRMSAAMLGEVITQDNHEFNIGGWFEFTKCIQGTFSKPSYAVKLWFVDQDKIGDGPGFVSGYKNHDLLLFSLDRRNSSSAPPIRIPDFLGRQKDASSEWFMPDKRHEFEFHIIYINDLKRAYFVVLENEKIAIKLDISSKGLSWSIDLESIKLACKKIRSADNSVKRLGFSSRAT